MAGAVVVVRVEFATSAEMQILEYDATVVVGYQRHATKCFVVPLYFAHSVARHNAIVRDSDALIIRVVCENELLLLRPYVHYQ